MLKYLASPRYDVAGECRGSKDWLTRKIECVRDFFRHSSFGFRHSVHASGLLLYAADDADERRKEREHDRADDKRQKHDHDWLEHRRDRRHRVIDLIVIHVGTLQKHIWQLTGFFAH